MTKQEIISIANRINIRNIDEKEISKIISLKLLVQENIKYKNNEISNLTIINQENFENTISKIINNQMIDAWYELFTIFTTESINYNELILFYTALNIFINYFL